MIFIFYICKVFIKDNKIKMIIYVINVILIVFMLNIIGSFFGSFSNILNIIKKSFKNIILSIILKIFVKILIKICLVIIIFIMLDFVVFINIYNFNFFLCVFMKIEVEYKINMMKKEMIIILYMISF